MATFKKSHEQTVSLFPVINILICTLGVMIFILTTITTISIGIDKTVIIVPEVHDLNKTHAKLPTYFEWNGYELTAYPSKQTLGFGIDIHKLKTFKKTYAYIDTKIKAHPIGNILNEIQSNSAARYMVFLIRPSGFHNFKDIKGYFESKGIDIGYEPIDQQLNIRRK
jgi:hypothetical protein